MQYCISVWYKSKWHIIHGQRYDEEKWIPTLWNVDNSLSNVECDSRNLHVSAPEKIVNVYLRHSTLQMSIRTLSTSSEIEGSLSTSWDIWLSVGGYKKRHQRPQNKGGVTCTISSVLILLSYFVLVSSLLLWPGYCLEPFYWGKKNNLVHSFKLDQRQVERYEANDGWFNLRWGDGRGSKRRWWHCPLLCRAYIQRW